MKRCQMSVHRLLERSNFLLSFFSDYPSQFLNILMWNKSIISNDIFIQNLSFISILSMEGFENKKRPFFLPESFEDMNYVFAEEVL